MTFESRNVDDLKKKIEEMFNFPFNYHDIAQKAQEKYNAETYYKEILNLYK